MGDWLGGDGGKLEVETFGFNEVCSSEHTSYRGSIFWLDGALY